MVLIHWSSYSQSPKINRSVPVNYDSIANTENLKSLSVYHHYIDSFATRVSDSTIAKNGLYQVDSVLWTHFHYYCSVNKPVGVTIAKGYFENDVPTGVWIKYNQQVPDKRFIEYLYFRNGICFKHIYFDHHNGLFVIDSITESNDTLISMFYNYHGGGEKKIYKIPQANKLGSIQEYDFNQPTMRPLDLVWVATEQYILDKIRRRDSRQENGRLKTEHFINGELIDVKNY